MDKEKVTEELVRQNGNQAAAVMADFAAQGGGDQPTPTPTPTPPPYTPNPRFDIDTILSGFPLSDSELAAALGRDVLNLGESSIVYALLDFPTFIGSYYYSGESEDFSLPTGFGAGNYLCYATFSKMGEGTGMLYMAPADTMAFKAVARLEYDGNTKVWNVTPVN